MLPLAAQDKGLGGVLESRSLLQRYGIAARTEAFHAIRGGHPDIGQVAKFLARLRIGQVNLDPVRQIFGPILDQERDSQEGET